MGKLVMAKQLDIVAVDKQRRRARENVESEGNSGATQTGRVALADPMNAIQDPWPEECSRRTIR